MVAAFFWGILLGFALALVASTIVGLVMAAVITSKPNDGSNGGLE